MPQQPSIGRIVHYVSHGTPGGEYTKECRAAVITELTGDPDHPGQVGLAVLNPTGFFFNRAREHHEAKGDDKGGTPGGGALNHPGGTWHWPERTA